MSYFLCKLYFGGSHRELDACPVNQEERLSDGKLTNELKCCDNCIVYVSPKGFTLSLNEIQSDPFIFLKSLRSISISASKILEGDFHHISEVSNEMAGELFMLCFECLAPLDFLTT